MSNFPSDPQLGAIHTVGRRLWTFNGEGWERGRQILSPPAEDPGAPLVPPVVVPAYIPLLKSLLPVGSKSYNLGLVNGSNLYYEDVSESYGTSQLSAVPAFGVTQVSSGGPISGRGYSVFPQTIPGAPPYDIFFAHIKNAAATRFTLINLWGTWILAFKPISAWNPSNYTGFLFSLATYYADNLGAFPISLLYDKANNRLQLQASIGDDFSTDFSVDTPNGSVSLDSWNYVIVDFRFGNSNPTTFDADVWLNGVRASLSTSKAPGVNIVNNVDMAIGTAAQYYSSAVTDAPPDGIRIRGHVAEFAGGLTFSQWMDDTKAAALYASFLGGV